MDDKKPYPEAIIPLTEAHYTQQSHMHRMTPALE